MSRHTLYLGKNSTAAIAAPAVEDVVREIFAKRFACRESAGALITETAEILRRALHFDASGAYWVDPDRPTSLSLIASSGLPTEFCEIARLIPVSDYDQVADIPYNDAHGSCYGDFFAPVAGAFGIRSWLVASLKDGENLAGAVLLGSRDGSRLSCAEARLALSLVAVAADHLAVFRQAGTLTDLARQFEIASNKIAA